MSTSESTIKHSGCKSLLKSYRPEMKLEKMSIDLSWLGNSRIPKFVPFEWQLKAAKCYPWLRDLTPLPNTGCTATEDVNGLRTIAALPGKPSGFTNSCFNNIFCFMEFWNKPDTPIDNELARKPLCRSLEYLSVDGLRDMMVLSFTILLYTFEDQKIV
ncbi:hypothetical protein C8J56DRAFT_890670 [Mycena floridula]|nr:hypothetical protein C8J56DRAFT_890670 [Mycena floridula]